jgi:outer membrane protein TolC
MTIATKATKNSATKITKDLRTRKTFVCFVSFVARNLRGLRRLVVCVAALVAVVAARTDAQEPLRLTLEQAQARARDASHRLSELRARGEAAEAVVNIRRAASQPNVSVLAGYTRTNHVEEFFVPGALGSPLRVIYPDIPDNYRTRLDLQWPIYSSGRFDALERAAGAEAAAATADLDTARQDLRLEVARAFWALVTARSSTTVLERAVERAQSHLSDVRERLNAGLVPPNEVASAEAQESRERMLLIEARNQRDVASSDLARLIGEAVLRPIEPVESLESGSPPSTSAADALLTEARTARSERRALERRIDASEERRAAAAAGARPTVSLGGGVDYARPNPRIFPRVGRWEDSWDASVNLSWPLWDGGRVKAETAEAAATTTATRKRLADFDSVLTLEVRQRLLELESTRAAVAAAEDGVRAATEAQRVVAERYAAGVVTHTEVLDAQLAQLQAELDRTRTLANVRLAEARLARAVGR